MAWEALQQSVLAGSADATAVSLKCMDGRGSDYEREQALAKLYFTDELPESARSLLAPTFADEPGARAPEPDTAPSVAGDPPGGPEALRAGEASKETSPYQTPRHISPEERAVMRQGLIHDAELGPPMAKRSRDAAGSPGNPAAAGADSGSAPPEAEMIAPAGSAPTALASAFAADLLQPEERDDAAPPAPEATEPPPIDWNRSWYDILGVARTAHVTTVKAAYVRLCALYHPDKAGAAHTSTSARGTATAMQRINHIWSILSNAATRKAYNKNPQDFPFPGSTWRADAEAAGGDATAPGDPPDPGMHSDASKDEPDLMPSFTLRWEPVNVAAVEKALQLAAVRSVNMENYDCFEILLSIRKRAVKVRRGQGKIAVIERASTPVGSLQNRLYSGIKGIERAGLPGCILAELDNGVPSQLAGLSVFAFSKCIRHLCRSGLGISEIDIVNAVFSVYCEILDAPEVVKFYRDNRDKVLREVGAWLELKSGRPLSRDSVKELFISLGFGGSVWSWMQDNLPEPVDLDGEWGSYMESFEDAMEEVRRALAEKYPEEFRLLAKGKRNPHASLGFHVYAHFEAKALQKMRAECGPAAISPEHDGIAGQGDPQKLLQACAKAVDPLRVAIKEYPQDPFVSFRKRFPELDWDIKADTTIKEYAGLLAKCRGYIAEDAGAANANKFTFAQLVAARLSPVVNVPAAEGEKRTHFEMFTGYGNWHSRHRDDLTAITMGILRDLVKPSIRMKWQRSEVAPDPPPPLNNIAFAASLGDSILGLLASKPAYAQLDGDVTRHRVLHSDGMVYHFDAKTLQPAKPEDRMGHRLSCPSKPWEPPEEVAGEAEEVFAKTIDFCRRAPPEVDRELCDMLHALSRHCEVLSVLLKFAGSWDLVIWLLRSMSRCAGGSARFCEFLYLYGPGSSGKDVVMLLFLTFFGEGPDNLGCVLNGGFIVDAHGGQVNKEAASPFLAATQGKRFIWVSEVPQHKNLQIDLIKQYCEQHGAPMTCRKLYKGPVTFRPIGMIAATSNYAVSVTNKDDDGFHRRARIWQTTQTFRAKPQKLTEHKADDTLKARILKGEFNAQLLWLLRGLWASLDSDINPGTTLLPIPELMKELEALSAGGGSQDALLLWIADCCEPVDRRQATKIQDFKKAAADRLSVCLMQIGPILTAAGINPQGVPNANRERVAVGAHPAWAREGTPGLRVRVGRQ